MASETILAIVAIGASTITAALSITISSKHKNKEFSINHYEKINKWYEETIQVIKFLDINSNDKLEREKLLKTLSTKIDICRKHFMNIEIGDLNEDKPEFFKGKRVVLTDLLVMIYKIYENNLQDTKRVILKNMGRSFVSEITLYLSNNENKSYKVPYKLIDKSNILLFENLEKEEFKDFFESKDVVEEIKKKNKIIDQQNKKVKLDRIKHSLIHKN